MGWDERFYCFVVCVGSRRLGVWEGNEGWNDALYPVLCQAVIERKKIDWFREMKSIYGKKNQIWKHEIHKLRKKSLVK